MDQQGLIKYHKEATDKMHDIMKRKNNDYANGGSAFKNFSMSEQFGICSTEQGFLVRMTDKLSRISTFVAGNKLKVKDESVKDTLMDLANYSLLLMAYIDSKEDERRSSITSTEGK